MNPFGSRRWHGALILFTVTFILAVIIEFGIGWFYQNTKAHYKLRGAAHELEKYLTYSDRWYVQRFERGYPRVLSYYILDSSGLNIDIQQFNPAMKLRVIADLPPTGLQTVCVRETGQTWRILVKNLKDGTLILGIQTPEDITHVDKRLVENADLFGSTVGSALQIKIEQADLYTQYAIVDDNFNLRFAVGGIPLLLEPIQGLDLNELDEVRIEGSLIYSIYSLTFIDKSGRMAGFISTFDEANPKPWYSLLYWIVNCLSSIVLASIVTRIGFPYIGEKFEPLLLLRGAMQKGESSTAEFKESLRWGDWQQKDQLVDEKTNEISEEIVIKAVVAFLNQPTGGTLLIGISNDKKIVGLERDYASLVQGGQRSDDKEKKRDRFQVHFRNLLSDRIGRDVSNLCIQTAIVEVDGKDVCVVNSRPASVPIYISDGKAKAFFVRDGASTVQLDVEQTVVFVEKRWPKAFWRRGWNMIQRW